MSESTQTPITKEGLIELGFEWMMSSPSDDQYSIRKGVERTFLCYIFLNKLPELPPITAYLGRIEKGQRFTLDNLKTIEQLKTIIEVCM